MLLSSSSYFWIFNGGIKWNNSHNFINILILLLESSLFLDGPNNVGIRLNNQHLSVLQSMPIKNNICIVIQYLRLVRWQSRVSQHNLCQEGGNFSYGTRGSVG